MAQQIRILISGFIPILQSGHIFGQMVHYYSCFHTVTPNVFIDVLALNVLSILSYYFGMEFYSNTVENILEPQHRIFRSMLEIQYKKENTLLHW